MKPVTRDLALTALGHVSMPMDIGPVVSKSDYPQAEAEMAECPYREALRAVTWLATVT